jgi:hypothetical protein
MFSGNVEKRKRVEFNGSDPVGGGEMVVQTHPEEMELLFFYFLTCTHGNDVQFTNYSFMSGPVQNPHPTQLYLYLYTIISYSARARLGRFPCVKPLCTHRSPPPPPPDDYRDTHTHDTTASDVRHSRIQQQLMIVRVGFNFDSFFFFFLLMIVAR